MKHPALVPRPGEMEERDRLFRVGDRVVRHRRVTRRNWFQRYGTHGTVMRLTGNWPSLKILFDGNKTLSSLHYTYVRNLSRLKT